MACPEKGETANGCHVSTSDAPVPKRARLPRPSSSSLLFRRDPPQEEELSWQRRCVEATLKGFAIGAGLRGGLALFSILVRLKSRGSSRFLDCNLFLINCILSLIINLRVELFSPSEFVSPNASIDLFD